MTRLRFLLATLLLWAAAMTHAANSFETEYTDDQGITYRIFQLEGEYVTFHALILRAVNATAYSLTIPDQLAVPGKINAYAPVEGFDPKFTCDCPRVTAINIKECTATGVVRGDFTGMPNLGVFWFYNPSDMRPSTNRAWKLFTYTKFTGEVSVYLSEPVQPASDFMNYYMYSWNDIVVTWRTHEKVDAIYCNYCALSDFVGVNLYSGNSNTGLKGTVVYIYAGASGTVTIPATMSVRLNGLTRTVVPDRIGYPGVVTQFNCSWMTTLEAQGDISIDEWPDFSLCTALKRLVFQAGVNLTGADFSANQIETVEFHSSDIILGQSLTAQSTLKNVYFYGDVPTLSGSPSKYFYNGGSGITFYMNMDIYEIAELKAANSFWASLNVQPIDPRSHYRKLTVVNEGPGTFQVRKQTDGQVTWANIKANSTRTIEVDRGSYTWMRNFALDDEIYRLSGFVFNDNQYIQERNMANPIQVLDKTNSLVAKYYQLDYPEGTQFDIHFSMVGDGWMEFRSSDENEWAYDPETGEYLYPEGMEHDGEVRDYVATYTDGVFWNIGFDTSYRKPKDGIIETLTVYANGIPQEPFYVDEDDSDEEVYVTYSIQITGDMDIQIVYEDNARTLSVVNGVGGTINVYRATVSDSVAHVGSGASLSHELPMVTDHYVVIRPDENKTVGAIFVNKPLSDNARLQLTADEYLQDDGSYRVPLTGFEESKDVYRLSVIYADKPCYTFDIAVIGNGKVDCIPFKVSDETYTPVRSVVASEATGRYQKVRAYYDEIGETGYVEYRLTKPKEGDALRVYWCGDDVTDLFTPMSNGTTLRGVIATTPEEGYLGIIMSSPLLAIYEPDPTTIIRFADPAAKAVCTAHWDTNGDGELSKAEAAAVTTLIDSATGKSVFRDNYDITSFDEFQYFTSLTSVEQSAFNRDSLRSIVLPPTITAIEKNAFYGSGLRSVHVPEGVVTIDDYAFDESHSLAEIVLPKSLKSIGNFAFSGTAIKQILIPEGANSITPYTGGNIFGNCKQLTSIAVDENNTAYDSRQNCSAIIKKAAGSLKPVLLYGCKNTIIPEGVAQIWAQAFRGVGIKNVAIPATVTSIGTSAFLSNQLDTLIMRHTEPLQFNRSSFNSFSSAATLSELANCVLIIPAGTLQAYTDAGWKTIADGGYFKEIVETAEGTRYDVDGDGHVSVTDLTKLVNAILGRP